MATVNSLARNVWGVSKAYPSHGLATMRGSTTGERSNALAHYSMSNTLIS